MWPFSDSYPEVDCKALAKEYDYIIVGGGTAGCALANRLSNDSSISVLIVERGLVVDTWASRVPLISTDFASDGSRTYRRSTVPQKNLDNRIIELFTGKVLGGTTRINSMVYNRGSAAEYNGWSAAGRQGWSFDDVLPHFKSAERFMSDNEGPERGKNGEWTVRMHDVIHFKPSRLVMDAAQKVGLPFIEDMNSSSSPIIGVAKCQFTMTASGQRNSAFSAFLPANLATARQSHLTVCTGTIATKIDVRAGSDGIPRAEGVFVRSASQKSLSSYVSAKREVILCSGPFGSPQILQLSGIGPRELLDRLSIPVLKDLPGVGAHLQDHLAVPITFHVPMEDSLVVLEKRPLTMLKELFKYLTRGKGLLLAPVLETCVFARSDLIDKNGNIKADASQLDASNPANLPDIELVPIAYDGSGEPFDKSTGSYGFFNALFRTESKGTVRIKSSDPDEPVEIDLAALSSPADFKVLRASLRLSLAIVRQMRADGYAMEDVLVPASDSDEVLNAYISRWGRTSYHYTSTCRMAPENDAGGPGVVDDELRVHGVKGLRVADTSIIPQMTSSHMQAPAVMIGLKCAQLIQTAH